VNGRDVASRVARHAARRYGLLIAVAVVPIVVVGCVGIILFAGTASTPPPGCGQQYLAVTGTARILATIRSVESGGRYDVRITTSTASGAYAFIDSAWAHYAAAVGVDIARYPSAWMAPADAQDAAANAYVNEILIAHHSDVEVVPLAWYLPSAIRRPELMDQVPPGGNRLTPRQYQARWLTEYQRQGTTPPTTTGPPTPTAPSPYRPPALSATSCPDTLAGASYTTPAGVTSLPACRISWGGYQPGRIPTSAMRYSPHSGYMHPAASAAWDQLWEAANAAGFNLTGNGYRPATQSSGASCSNHWWGLAIDVTVLTGPNGFNTPEYRWLAANAARYGFANPDFARPVSRGGTGRGGWAGGTCCHLEAWHFDFVAFLQLPTS
jgi:hypothetical protein